MENIKIKSYEEAVKHLSAPIANIVRNYCPQNSDDISQECWLQVFKLIHSRGEVDYALLLKTLKYAAANQVRLLGNAGLTPNRSTKAKRPTPLTYVPDGPHEDGLERFIQDLLLDVTGKQHAFVTTARLLISDGKRPTLKAIANELGTTLATVRYQLEKLRKKYNDNNKA